METDYAIIGGGVVGLSVAWGLLRRGKSVTVLDGDDGSFRASRGNFGLVWVQSKGMNQPRYAEWSQQSAAIWAEFADELGDAAGHSVPLEQKGGYDFHFSEDTLQARIEDYETLKAKLGGNYPYEVLGHNALRKEEPHIGPKVVGAILHHQDGHANPLKLLTALAADVRHMGGQVIVGKIVIEVSKPDSFRITCADGTAYGANNAGCLACIETRTELPNNNRLHQLIRTAAPATVHRRRSRSAILLDIGIAGGERQQPRRHAPVRPLPHKPSKTLRPIRKDDRPRNPILRALNSHCPRS